MFGKFIFLLYRLDYVLYVGHPYVFRNYFFTRWKSLISKQIKKTTKQSITYLSDGNEHFTPSVLRFVEQSSSDKTSQGFLRYCHAFRVILTRFYGWNKKGQSFSNQNYWKYIQGPYH